MARRVNIDTQYTFTPSTRTVVIPKALPRERLLLITNVTNNTVIYNFSDPTLTATAYSIAQNTNNTNATTTVVLSYNTTSMNTTDKLSIVVDEPSESFIPDEAYQDPVGKMRVSTPQSLIDTDFEYGLQPTKWESLTLIGNRPCFFINPQNPLAITDITATNGSANIIITLSGALPAVGTPIQVSDSNFAGANGPELVRTSGSGAISYQAQFNYTGTTGSIFNSAATQAFTGTLYTGAAYNLTAQPTNVGNVVTVNTAGPHNLQIGDGVYVSGATASTLPPNGSFQVISVPTASTFQYLSADIATGSILSANVLPRPDGEYRHRAFDGGVQFTTSSSAPNLQCIRQTRRYFRYQSGKGLQISTGTLLKPNLNLEGLTATGSTATVTTKFPHNTNAGTVITVAGANESAYNGTFTVDQIIDAFRFTYIMGSAPTASPASGLVYVSVINWYGSTVRVGIFDSQNGFFFEYDGQNLWAVRRKSTDQISGRVNCVQGNNYITGATVNGVTPIFTKQLQPGDFIVIRGASYRINDIFSDTVMTISPPYRGGNLLAANTTSITKTIDTRVPQSAWNMDKCDGTGPSGLVLDLSKMNMFYIDYSWYGAGTIRYGFRDTQGKVFYCHRTVNSSQNYEAYMRSGNLPARYEVNTFSLATNLAANLGIGATTMQLGNVINWPSSGTVVVADPGAGGYEYINYTGIYYGNATLVGLVRAPNLAAGTTEITSVGTTVNIANVTTSSSISTLQAGMAVVGVGIPGDTYITSIYPGAPSTIKLSKGASATGTVTLKGYSMGSNTAAHNVTSTTPIGVYVHAPQFAPTISHWGTSVIMDGRFDDDKSLVFVYGENTFANVAPGQSVALMTLRSSPSADNGTAGQFGTREIVNRMQLTLSQIEVLCQGSFIINLVLNANLVLGTSNTSGPPTLGTYQRIDVGTSSLAQVADHLGNVQTVGGENAFGFYAVNVNGAGNFSVYTQELKGLRDLGNSILGGGLTANVQLNFYPDGPDTLTVVARNIGTGFGNVSSRLSWTEAQA